MKKGLSTILVVLLLACCLFLMGVPKSPDKNSPFIAAAASAFGENVLGQPEDTGFTRFTVKRGRALLYLFDDAKIVFIPKSSDALPITPDMKLALRHSKALNSYTLSVDGDLNNLAEVKTVPDKLFKAVRFGDGQIVAFKKKFPEHTLALIIDTKSQKAVSAEETVSYPVIAAFEFSRSAPKSGDKVNSGAPSALPLFELVKPVENYASIIKYVVELQKILSLGNEIVGSDLLSEQSTSKFDRLTQALGSFKRDVEDLLKNPTTSASLKKTIGNFLKAMNALPETKGIPSELSTFQKITQVAQQALIQEITKSSKKSAAEKKPQADAPNKQEEVPIESIEDLKNLIKQGARGDSDQGKGGAEGPRCGKTPGWCPPNPNGQRQPVCVKRGDNDYTCSTGDVDGPPCGGKCPPGQSCVLGGMMGRPSCQGDCKTLNCKGCDTCFVTVQGKTSSAACKTTTSCQGAGPDQRSLPSSGSKTTTQTENPDTGLQLGEVNVFGVGDPYISLPCNPDVFFLTSNLYRNLVGGRLERFVAKPGSFSKYHGTVLVSGNLNVSSLRTPYALCLFIGVEGVPFKSPPNPGCRPEWNTTAGWPNAVAPGADRNNPLRANLSFSNVAVSADAFKTYTGAIYFAEVEKVQVSSDFPDGVKYYTTYIEDFTSLGTTRTTLSNGCDDN